MGDRAQSELVGFALTFAIVLLAILLVAAMGTAGIDTAQEHHQTANIQPAFSVLGNNVDDIVRHGAPSRGTELKLVSASLAVEEVVEFEIDDGNTTETYTLHGIVYDSGSGTTISYAGGLLVREDDGATTTFGQPGFIFSERSIVLPMIDTRPDGTTHVGGTTTVLVEKRHSQTATWVIENPGNVSITVSGVHADPWESYLSAEATSAESCEPVDETTITCSPERAYVIVERIDVEIS